MTDGAHTNGSPNSWRGDGGGADTGRGDDVTTYRIKPLVWVEKRTCNVGYHEAATVFGVIQAWERKYASSPPPEERCYWSIDVDGDGEAEPDDGGFAPTIEAAKSAAESWYRGKMCEGLEEVTPC